MNESKRYVYNGTEVKLTGRTATKNIDKVSRRTQTKSIVAHTIYEITPASLEEGSWKKWVDLTELFVITES